MYGGKMPWGGPKVGHQVLEPRGPSCQLTAAGPHRPDSRQSILGSEGTWGLVKSIQPCSLLVHGALEFRDQVRVAQGTCAICSAACGHPVTAPPCCPWKQAVRLEPQGSCSVRSESDLKPSPRSGELSRSKKSGISARTDCAWGGGGHRGGAQQPDSRVPRIFGLAMSLPSSPVLNQVKTQTMPGAASRGSLSAPPGARDSSSPQDEAQEQPREKRLRRPRGPLDAVKVNLICSKCTCLNSLSCNIIC